jgi:YggT family protein
MSVNAQTETQMIPVLNTIMYALNIYIWILIAAAIFSWLYAFNVINSRNQFVNMLGRFLNNITEPVLRPIRRFMPDLGGVDISPIIVFILIYLIQQLIIYYLYPLAVSSS